MTRARKPVTEEEIEQAEYERSFYARMGDPYLDGPVKSFGTPKEDDALHKHVAELRAKALASKVRVKVEQPETCAATKSDGRVMIWDPTGTPSLHGHGGQAPSQPIHPDRQSMICCVHEDAISKRDPDPYISEPLMIPSVRRVTGANREPIKPRLPIENTSKVEFDGRKASGHVTANIGTPLMVPSVPCGTGSNRYPVAVKPRVPIENTPKVECAGPTVSGGVETSLSIRLKHGPDSMTSRCDAAVAQRNAALATQRVKLEPSRWWQDRKRATVQSSRGRPRSQAATKPAYIDKYRPAGKTRTKHHIDSYCLSDSSRAGSSARLPPALGSSGTNAKRTRFEMEDQPKDARSSSSEPSKRPKTTETKPLDQMKTLKQVEAALCAINGKLKNIGKTYPMTSVVREAERLIKQHKLVRLRRDELDEKNKKDKMVNYLAYKSLLWSSPNSIKVAPKGSKRSNHDIATETKKSDYAPKVPSSADNAELSDGVGQFATMTQKNAGRGTAYPGKSTGRVNAPGLAHALVGNAEQLMKTTTDVRRNTLGMEHATPKTVPRSTTENETAAAIDSLIASGKAAAQSLCAYPKVEHQPSSKRRRATAAELNDEVYPRYRMDWDDEDVEMSLP